MGALRFAAGVVIGAIAGFFLAAWWLNWEYYQAVNHKQVP